jgi:lipopolysaccharide/colanic/teichoic acid biosynthesis glycosyltransferase
MLRRSKVDELPQLWNVVRGDMSIVGPRPEVPRFVDLKDPVWNEILKARPGLTDPVALRLRNEEQLLADLQADELVYLNLVQSYKLRGYLNFMRKRTWMGDIKIICRTVVAITFPGTAVPPSRNEMLLSFAEGHRYTPRSQSPRRVKVRIRRKQRPFSLLGVHTPERDR